MPFGVQLPSSHSSFFLSLMMLSNFFFIFAFPLSLGCNSQLQVPWNWEPFSPLGSWVGHSGERNRDEPKIVWRRSKTEVLGPSPLKRWSWISWRLYCLILPSYYWKLVVYNTIISVLLFLRFYFHTGSVNVERKKKSLRNTASISPNDTIRDEKLWKMTKLWKTKSHQKRKKS